MSAPDDGALRVAEPPAEAPADPPAEVPAVRRRRGPYAKSAERRRAIVAAAFDVFATRGFRAASLREVAERVGMSQTTLLHHFPSKEELFLAVIASRDAVEPVLAPDALRGLAAEDPRIPAVRFADLITTQASFNEGVPGVIQLYAVLVGEGVTDDHPGRDYFAERFARMRAGYVVDLERLRDLGLLRDGVDPAIAAATIIALWDGIQLQWLYDADAVDMAAALRDYLALILPLPA
ncbi:TetR family transcriptional regulator [Labedella gwakjiensis]|uniref:TetR family transcriptional regulator n=1 Tax=Labedella gwakjiensis TaxID=390269 RepID=A0A2P8GU42_9MICO|nr:TetR/AcrR family transcriptional regulator [Labedella gwakjiensis]PSL37480.1 TetR family transcriptional regulator [Labedella gwakjiensis]RUQ84788.1 TetR/AcrR family transcriptional regulator [Labedella gwakjiensis]